jgi:aryl-alcohol dehydrogenase-like predicted oxidoreductase
MNSHPNEEIKMNSSQLIPLGDNGILVSPIGVGTWQWGDRMYWGYSRTHNATDVEGVFEISIDSGINFFDTAEVYGNGVSEKMLGYCIQKTGCKPIVATKFMPLPWRLSKRELRNALNRSLRRLNLPRIDLYQMHWPFPPITIEMWMEGMAGLISEGLVHSVGVSNYNLEQTMRANEALNRKGLSLASNQVEYSLLDRTIEKNGLMNACREMGIRIIAYSPLGKGMLSGKYSYESPPSGLRSRKYNRNYLRKISPLIEVIREIGKEYGGKTPAQVAINWIVCKGAIAIPGAKNTLQALDNIGSLGWRLSEESILRLDQISDQCLI